MKKYIAEFIGTLVLVLFGTGIAVVSGGDLVATALAFGLAIVAEAYVIGDISGCHVNPAVSLAMFLNKKLTKRLDNLSHLYLASTNGNNLVQQKIASKNVSFIPNIFENKIISIFKLCPIFQCLHFDSYLFIYIYIYIVSLFGRAY